MMHKKKLALAVALLAGTAFASQAAADVVISATIDKTKEITVNTSLVITKTVDLVAFNRAPLEVDGVVDALAIVNQRNQVNVVGPPESPPSGVGGLTIVQDVVRTSEIRNSISGNSGIVGVNQDSGSMNNQGNNVALAYSDVPNLVLHAEGAAEQINTNNVVTQNETFPEPDPIPDWDAFVDPKRIAGIGGDDGPQFINPADAGFNPFWTSSAIMSNSVNFNLGIVGVNQSSGYDNNQANLFSAAIGVEDQVALAEGALGQTNADNSLVAANTFVRDIMEGSVRNNVGVIGVNQTSGHMNNQAGVFSIAATQNSVEIGAGFVGGIPGGAGCCGIP